MRNANGALGRDQHNGQVGEATLNDVVMVFTSESLETMRVKGGSGNWVANKKRIERVQWVVAARNRRPGRTQGSEEHGSAFLIGRVTGTKSASAPEQRRLVIVFDNYAEIAIPNVWTHSRNPVAYTSLSALGVDLDKLAWKVFAALPYSPAVSARRE